MNRLDTAKTLLPTLDWDDHGQFAVADLPFGLRIRVWDDHTRLAHHKRWDSERVWKGVPEDTVRSCKEFLHGEAGKIVALCC